MTQHETFKTEKRTPPRETQETIHPYVTARPLGSTAIRGTFTPPSSFTYNLRCAINEMFNGDAFDYVRQDGEIVKRHLGHIM